GGHNHLVPDPRRAYALTDFTFIIVHLRGIDVAVANADRLLSEARAITAAQGPGAKPDDRDLESPCLDRRRKGQFSVFAGHYASPTTPRSSAFFPSALVASPLRRIPFRRMRRIDYTHIGRVEFLQIGHLGIRELKIKHIQILLQ